MTFDPNYEYEPQWFEKCDWGCTNEQHIWHNVTTDKYHFSDETSNFDKTGYDTIEDAMKALEGYCETLTDALVEEYESYL